MATELRKTGISIVGDMPWGTHFCHFYETKEDLLDILLPYFKTGLENNEFCLWVVSDPLGEEEAKNAFRQAIPEPDRYLATGRIEIVPNTEQYFKGGAFVPERVINGWNEKLAGALAEGYDGMRVNGIEAWLTKEHWKDFSQYENTLDITLDNRRMIVLCSYPLAGAGAAEIFDVVHTHQYAVVRRKGNWEVLESPEIKQAKAEIKRLNEDLEQRVVERTQELAAANEQMRREITEREWSEEALRSSESRLAEAQRLAHVGSWGLDLRNNNLIWSDEHYHIFGLRPGEIDTLYEIMVEQYIHPEDRGLVRGTVENSRRTLEPFNFYYRVVRPDGVERIIHSLGNVVGDEQGNAIRMFGTAQDVTEIKQAEEQLRTITEQLRALSAKIGSAREEESTRIAREIHDELGAALSSLRWDLEDFDEMISDSGELSQPAALRQKIQTMVRLIDTTVDTVRRISSELRPLALDELGLVEAIKWQTQQFQHRTGIIVECDCHLEDLDLDRNVSTAVFRIFQEALTNVLRHAQAKKVDIMIKQEANEFLLMISDNGKGITEDEKSGMHSIGLLGMVERAHLISGEIHIEGAEGLGTVITVRVPNPAKSTGGSGASL
jgi:PAS domain S-box-containing protein